jgi:hypothetical protein
MMTEARAIYGAVPKTKGSRSISLAGRVTPDVAFVTRGDVELYVAMAPASLIKR